MLQRACVQRTKKQTLTASDVTDLEVAKTLVPPGIKLGECNIRSRWYSRDDSIGFSCEKAIKKWGDLGSLALCVQSSWDAVGLPNPHAWIAAIIKEFGADG